MEFAALEVFSITSEHESHIPEDGILHSHHCENRKSHIAAYIIYN
jgi:hypothetical protein